jgi:hypothetical protein
VSTEERCEACGRRRGTQADLSHDHDSCPDDCGSHLCWGGDQCAAGRVDWRSRALATEAALADAVDKLRSADDALRLLSRTLGL